METRRLAFVLGALWVLSLARAENWTQFRGPNQDGTSSAADVPVTWSETGNIAWKTAIPGKAWSSPVVANGKIWLTTAVEHEPSDAERERLLAKVDPKKVKVRQVKAKVEFRAVQVDLSSGEIERDVALLEADAPDSIHTLNSFASPTPVLEDERLFCDFGTFGTVALNVNSGKVIWKRRFQLVHSVGPGSSPVVTGNLLILVRDGVDVQYVIALDKTSGETIWKTERPPMNAPSGDQKKAYCTPLLVRHKGSRQLVIPTSQWIVSYVPETGEEIWRVNHGSGFSLVPRPVYGNGLVYACTGFGKPQLWAIRPDGTGDVSESHVVWKEPKRIPKKPSPLLVGGRLYVLDDGGIVSCLNALTGEEIWADRVGGNYSASPIFADGRIYVCSQEGQTTVLAHADEFQVLEQNEIDGAIMASPVPVDGALLLRSEAALYRIGG